MRRLIEDAAAGQLEADLVAAFVEMPVEVLRPAIVSPQFAANTTVRSAAG